MDVRRYLAASSIALFAPKYGVSASRQKKGVWWLLVCAFSLAGIMEGSQRLPLWASRVDQGL